MAELRPELIMAAGQNNTISVPDLLQQAASTYDTLQSLPLIQQQRQLALESQKRQSSLQQQQNDQFQERQKAQILLQNARALKSLPMEQRRTYVASLDPQVLQTFGIDKSRLGALQLDDVSLSNAIAQLDAVVSQPGSIQTTGQERTRDALMRELEGALTPDGRLKPIEELTAKQLSAARELNIIARPVGSATQTITQEGTAEQVAGTEATIAGAKAGASEAAKADVQLDMKPKIAAAVKAAEQQAAAAGEAFTDFKRAQAALPGVEEVVGQLKDLAPLATSTIGGKVFDEAVKQLGFGSTKGATARAKFTALIDNQVLPLLRDTFGAAFTVKEMETLKATMGDPDASPDVKMAQLETFVQNKYRELERKEREAANLGAPVTPAAPEAGTAPKRLKYNPATGRLE